MTTWTLLAWRQEGRSVIPKVLQHVLLTAGTECVSRRLLLTHPWRLGPDCVPGGEREGASSWGRVLVSTAVSSPKPGQLGLFI